MRIVASIVALLAAVAGASSQAQPAEQIVFIRGSTYAPGGDVQVRSDTFRSPTLIVPRSQGVGLRLWNVDGQTHTLVSGDPDVDDPYFGDGKFASGRVGFNQQSPVVFQAALAPGDYRFFCSLHPDVRGTLTVV